MRVVLLRDMDAEVLRTHEVLAAIGTSKRRPDIRDCLRRWVHPGKPSALAELPHLRRNVILIGLLRLLPLDAALLPRLFGVPVRHGGIR